MERKPVQSSNLVSVGYDPATRTLEVEFKAGEVYTYEGVPPRRHADLLAAPSLGKYFHTHIRSGYPFKKTKG